jgi:hypothetical protein
MDILRKYDFFPIGQQSCGVCFILALRDTDVALFGGIISFLVQLRRGNPSKVCFAASEFRTRIILRSDQLNLQSVNDYSYSFNSGRFTLSLRATQNCERLRILIVTADVRASDPSPPFSN